MENARNCVDLSHDCPKRRSLCHNDLFEDLMREQCRKTCNFCDEEIDIESTSELPGEEPFIEEPYVEETTHSSAEDLDSNAEETELPDPELVEVTRQPLRKLDNCVDRSYGCEAKRHLCHRRQYRSIMAKSCAKTCGICGSSSYSKGRHIDGSHPYPRISKPSVGIVCRDTSHDCITKTHLCDNQQRKERSEQNNIEDHLNDINTDAQFDALDYSIAHPYSC
ncbi:unnamed protein product [Enterobius vermicularis]|uniref:ShKT domain-containing protein n=1 Tax=Enterobius vermicularis TaxID=51028 RepID=A0A0N4V562_ENTVE|nr:unnamed protein product [Enterobius vermicularis]